MLKIMIEDALADLYGLTAKVEDWHPSSKLLTEALFSPKHPFGERLREKVAEDEIAMRRIQIAFHKVADPDGEPRLVSISLEVVLRDEWYKPTPHDEMQTMYINGKLAEYINEQRFNVPTAGTAETTKFLHWLEQYVPDIWTYFHEVEAPIITHNDFMEVAPLFFKHTRAILADKRMRYAKTPEMWCRTKPIPLGAFLICCDTPEQINELETDKTLKGKVRRMLFEMSESKFPDDLFTLDQVLEVITKTETL